MKDIEQIKQELTDFGRKYRACGEGLKTIKGNNLKELFENINKYIIWCKKTPEKNKEFNAIFENELIIEDGILLCNCTNLTSIIIPDSITSIKKSTFWGCEELTSVTIPNSVTSIGDSAFAYCNKLTSIIIPNSVTSIEDYAFQGCDELTSIVIPNSVTSIGSYVFAYCRGLKSVTIPNSISLIGDFVFFGCNEDLKIITL